MIYFSTILGLVALCNIRVGECFYGSSLLQQAFEITRSYADSAKNYTYCQLKECCNNQSIPANITELENILKSNVFGQHIVLEKLIPALQAHFSNQRNSRKPLVISFHGTSGTGKNFVSEQIAKAIYAKGLKSKYVHRYMGRADFPIVTEVNDYKERINREVRKGIEQCPTSLFIFDEVDKMPSGIFESLTSLVDYNALIDGQDSTKAIFLFLSNAAGVQIADRLSSLIESGELREDIKLSHFEQILEKAAYNVEGGMQKTGLIESHVIDHYLPFLPLEKKHVYKCIEAEFKLWNVKPTKKIIDSIIADSIVYDPKHNLFAISGCKTLDKKVALAAHTELAKRQEL